VSVPTSVSAVQAGWDPPALLLFAILLARTTVSVSPLTVAIVLILTDGRGQLARLYAKLAFTVPTVKVGVAVIMAHPVTV
jgi:hypothetical protein